MTKLYYDTLLQTICELDDMLEMRRDIDAENADCLQAAIEGKYIRLHEVVREMLFLERPEDVSGAALRVGKYGEMPF